MSKQMVALVVGVIALASFAGGCGSGSEESSSKPAFIQQGDAVCKQVQNEITADAKALQRSQGVNANAFPSQTQLNELVEEVYLPGIEKRMAALRDLDPPVSDEERVEAIYRATEKGIAKTEKEVKLFFSDDPFKEARELTQEYGFKVCGLI